MCIRLRLDGISNFGGCPWVKLDPAWMYSGSETSAQHEAQHEAFIMSEGMNAVDDSGNLNLLSRAAEAVLETHTPNWFLPGSYGFYISNLRWFRNCLHAHALFQDGLKDVQVGSRWFSTLYWLQQILTQHVRHQYAGQRKNLKK